MQYHRPREQDGMVIAFRRHLSPYTSFACRLREIDPRAEYEVTRAADYQPSRPAQVEGSELRQLRVQIEQCPGSVVIEYRKVK